MKRYFAFAVFAIGSLGICSIGSAQSVEYVKVCNLYGAGFHYIPGTDICVNDMTSDARQEVENQAQTLTYTWRSFLPYPAGKWVTNTQQECALGRLIYLGNFKSTDFTLNNYNRKQTAPVRVPVNSGEFISEVMMSGGFYTPFTPTRLGANDSDGLCVRSIDPTLVETSPTGPVNPPYGDSGLPIGCVANSRIANMPAAYAVEATAAYPDIEYQATSASSANGPYTYGGQLVVTTDLGAGGPNLLTYNNGAANQPLVGTVSVSVCIAEGQQQGFGGHSIE